MHSALSFLQCYAKQKITLGCPNTTVCVFNNFNIGTVNAIQKKFG